MGKKPKMVTLDDLPVSLTPAGACRLEALKKALGLRKDEVKRPIPIPRLHIDTTWVANMRALARTRTQPDKSLKSVCGDWHPAAWSTHTTILGRGSWANTKLEQTSSEAL